MQDVIIQADSVLSATYQARAQYGEENVHGMASPISSMTNEPGQKS
jgi:hypothetical protein